MSKVWALKHRPSIDDIVGQDDIINAIGNGMQHMVFYSPQAGTGKTSLAHALAKRHDMTLHIFNASSKKTRGIEFVEEELMPMSRTGNWKQIFLLDEADQLTPAAQSALKGVIENAHGWFILTCNDLSKVSVWLQSRCRVLKFNPISDEHMKQRLITIAGKEGVEITPNHLALIINNHRGDLRNAINALQAYSNSQDKHSFIHSLENEKFDVQQFLTLCFREKDFEESLKLLDKDNKRESIRAVFRFAMESNAKAPSKLKVIEAAVTSERDFIMGVDEDIILSNFVLMCIR
jgi:DNA polymerase III delta prime subunit